MQLNFLRIQNLRSLADTGRIELRPLTLLIGTNSSGKSTFLRSFPLLRQSVETPTAGPILWYGRYVDFGSFTEAVRQNSSPENITLEFGLQLRANNTPERRYMFYGSSTPVPLLEDLDAHVSITLAKGTKDGKTFAQTISIKFLDDAIKLCADEQGNISEIQINELDAVLESKGLRFVPSESFIPLLELRPEAAKMAYKRAEQIHSRMYAGPFADALQGALQSLFPPNKKIGTWLGIAYEIGIGSPQAQLKQLRTLLPSSRKGCSKKAKALKTTDETYRKIRNAVFGGLLPRIIRELGERLAVCFRSVRYIAPVRATAERYYRQQDFSVDEVDPQGANLAMFLQTLPSDGKQQFSSWCQSSLGFSIHAKADGAHISLRLKEAGTRMEYNIADVGFGFSQILPALAQIWSLTQGVRRGQVGLSPRRRFVRNDSESERGGDIIAIEQPELHLHPRLQAKVADMLVAAAQLKKKTGHPLAIICETHSETIINRIGHLIALGRLEPKDVQILLFDKVTSESDTKVSQSTFSAEGVLQNWPHGFFLAAADDSECPFETESKVADP